LRGKRATVGACAFFGEPEREIFTLQRALERREYVPGGYRTLWIRDPRPRLISAAPLRDRVVHHAIVRVVESIFERRFIHHSHACRRGRGTHRALQCFVGWVRSHRYELKLGVHRFSPSLDHEILKARLRRTSRTRACSGSATRSSTTRTSRRP
jgi:hypothetical protein